MTRRYSQPIQAQVYCGRLLSFIWRDTYYRLDCSGDLQCDVYFDAATGVWILDRVHD